MSQTFVLQPLLDLGQEQLDAAARMLAELIAQENESGQKLQLLKDYRGEYIARFEAAARDGLSPGAWRNYSAFIGRIDEAIAAQQAAVENARVQTAQGKEEWVERRNRLKAYDTLHLRHKEKEAKQKARREQKQIDEHNTNRFIRNRLQNSDFD